MAPTSARFIDKIIYEGLSIVALGATTFKNGKLQLLTGMMDAYSTTGYYIEIKYDELHYI
jgi:hypothetical protein